MPVVGLHHVQLAIPPGGEDLARQFYGEILGLPEVPKPPALAQRGGCWFESDVVRVHLGVDQDFRAANKAHPALLVSDLPAMVGELKAAGAKIVDDEQLEGFTRVYAYDPFGNRIELLEPLSDSPAAASERQPGRFDNSVAVDSVTDSTGSHRLAEES